MAYVFYAALHRALSAGRVKAAAEIEDFALTGCDKKFGNAVNAGKNHA